MNSPASRAWVGGATTAGLASARRAQRCVRGLLRGSGARCRCCGCCAVAGAVARAAGGCGAVAGAAAAAGAGGVGCVRRAEPGVAARGCCRSRRSCAARAVRRRLLRGRRGGAASACAARPEPAAAERGGVVGAISRHGCAALLRGGPALPAGVARSGAGLRRLGRRAAGCGLAAGGPGRRGGGLAGAAPEAARRREVWRVCGWRRGSGRALPGGAGACRRTQERALRHDEWPRRCGSRRQRCHRQQRGAGQQKRRRRSGECANSCCMQAPVVSFRRQHSGNVCSIQGTRAHHARANVAPTALRSPAWLRDVRKRAANAREDERAFIGRVYCSAILRTSARAVPSASPITRKVFESNSMPVRRRP